MHEFGWSPPPQEEQEKILKSLPIPMVAMGNSNILGTGRGKQRLLYEYTRMMTGGREIAQRQGTDDCVAFGASHAVDHTLACDIFLKKEFDEFEAMTATEPIYGGSRIQIGRGRLGSSGGSYGSWAAKFVSEYAILPMKKYEKHDLRTYSAARAKQWGMPNQGCPKDLLEYGSKNKIQTVSLVRTWAEVCDLLYNGCAITIASMAGFTSTRDSRGRCRRSGTWSHQMCLIGYIDDNQPQACVLNSWGRYMTGPTFLGSPQESFWVPADVLVRDILSSGDCWAFSNVLGFEKKNLDFTRWS